MGTQDAVPCLVDWRPVSLGSVFGVDEELVSSSCDVHGLLLGEKLLSFPAGQPGGKGSV